VLTQLKFLPADGPLGFLGALTFPVVFTFPLALFTIIIVSKLDGKLPDNVDQIWMRIHGTAHERMERDMGLDKVGTMFGGGK